MCREDRLKLLENAIRLFYFQYDIITKSSKYDFFKGRYNKSTVGTLFGDTIYIIRCINTSVALCVALVKYDDIAFSRISTRDVEGFYGIIRELSFHNNTFLNAVRVAVRSIIVSSLFEELNFKYEIRTRDNEGGAAVGKEILESNCANTDFSYIADSIFLLFKSMKLCDEQCSTFCKLVNNFSFYLEKNGDRICAIQSIYSGTLPHHRYTTGRYALSLLNSKNDNTFFSFYNKDFQIKEQKQEKSSRKWFLHFVDDIKTFKELLKQNKQVRFSSIKKNDPYKEMHGIIVSFFQSILTKQIENEQSEFVLRLDDHFNPYVSDDPPINAKGNVIIFDESDEMIRESKPLQNEHSNLTAQQSTKNVKNNSNIFNVKEIIMAFNKFRRPDLKKEKENFKCDQLFRDISNIY